MKGRIHSIETFGTVDGPGIRFILFMQGCSLRCQYCHNRDTWNLKGGKEVTVEEIIAEIEPYLNYYRSSGGGLTVSGGEPTLQWAFVKELFIAVKERWNLHTTLDTNGVHPPERIKDLYKVTDLVLLDIKHMNNEKHKHLVGCANQRMLENACWLSEHGKKMWIRHVFVPTKNDDAEDLRELGRFLASLHGVEKFDLLPYHTMGTFKWQELGVNYPLQEVKTPSEAELERAKRLIEEGKQEFWHEKARKNEF